MKKVVVAIFVVLVVFLVVFFIINKDYISRSGGTSGNVVFDGANYFFSAGNAIVVINYGNGNLLNVTYQNEPLLTQVSNISALTFKDGTTAYSSWFRNVGTNLYQIQYKRPAGEIVGTLILNVTEMTDHLFFEVLSLSPGLQDFDNVLLFQARPKNASQSQWFADWATSAADDEPFMDVVALTDNVLCGVEGSPGGGGVWYRCKITHFINYSSAKFAFFVAEKKDYSSTLERIILSHPETLKAKLNDGVWHRNSIQQKENYLFVVLNQNTCSPQIGGQCIVGDIARKGGFETVLAFNPLRAGYYNESIRYDSTDEFNNALQNIQEKNASVAVHTFINKIENGDGLINFSSNSVSFERALFNGYIGTLLSDINSFDANLYIDVNVPTGSVANLENNTNFSYYYLGQEPRGKIWGVDFIVGANANEDEIISCYSYNGYSLGVCLRGQYETGAQAHATGTPVYVLPHHATSFHFNPFSAEGRQLQQQSATAFANTVSSINASMLYFDGSPFPSLPNMSSAIIYDYEHYIGVLPYMRAIENEINAGYKDSFPLIQTADTPWSIGTTYLLREASDDGVVFKNKDNVRNWKLYLIEKDWNPYARTKHELGWWKFHGTNIGSGRYDYDAVTLDDLEYVFGKALAYETSIGVHFEESFNSYKHGRMDEFLSKMRVYQNFAKDQFVSKTIPESMLSYLRNASHEAFLTNNSGYQLVEKKFYRFISRPENRTFIFSNPFDEQEINFELRPKFDYYAPDNTTVGHTTISNFDNIPAGNIKTSSSSVICTINATGSVTITNSGATVGGCEITIPSSSVNMTFKRGLALTLGNNGGNELITVRLGNFPTRDFNYLLNSSFSVSKTVILDEPTGEAFDIIDGVNVAWQSNTWKARNWEMDYGTVPSVKVYINNIPANTLPASPRVVNLINLKALQEKKPTTVFMPNVTLNGEKVILPVNLSIDKTLPHIFSLGDNGEYKIYSENYTLLETGSLSFPKVANGINTIIVEPGLDGGERMDIRIQFDDDADNDGIPARGAFDTQSIFCDEGEDFCNDNCEGVYNPDQHDSNDNGVGDACDSVISGGNGNNNGGSGGNGGGGGSSGGDNVATNNNNGEECVPNWQCSDWSDCINSEQTRTCYDSNICGIDVGVPEERKECGESVVGENEEETSILKNSKNYLSVIKENGVAIGIGFVVLLAALVFIFNQQRMVARTRNLRTSAYNLIYSIKANIHDYASVQDYYSKLREVYSQYAKVASRMEREALFKDIEKVHREILDEHKI